MNTPPESQDNLYPKTDELIEGITSLPSKKARKQFLRDKKNVGKNNDYEVYQSIANGISTNFNEAKTLVEESKLFLAEAPNAEVSSLTESLEKDLEKIQDQVKYHSTVFNGVRGKGTVNIQQRLKVLQVSEAAEKLSNQLLFSILPTAAELGVKLVEHIEKIEEELNHATE